MLTYFWALPPDLNKILYEFLRSNKKYTTEPFLALKICAICGICVTSENNREPLTLNREP